MSHDYNIDKWDATKNLFIWQFRLGGKELPEWNLAEAKNNQHFAGHPMQEYYWEQGNRSAMAKVDVISTSSWKEAQAVFQSLLRESMIEQLPTLPENLSRLGDAAYTGPGGDLRGLFFLRANMIIQIYSIGKEVVKTDRLGIALDGIFTQAKKPEDKRTRPDIRTFEAGKSEIRTGEKVPLHIRAEDPLQRPLWFRFTTDNGEIAQEHDQLVFFGEKTGESRLTVQAVNAEGDIDERSIAIRVV